MSTSSVIEQHTASGGPFTAAGITSFVLDHGQGPPVVCLHGVPTSSFLYRKVVAELAARGLRGIAFDLPGLGLADRPEDADYTWTGLGRFALAALDALELDRVHLVIHDIGGPVGFEVATAVPDRIASLTVLNSLVDVDTFRRPWSMAPFATPLGPLYLRAMNPFVFRRVMLLQGIADHSRVSEDEIDAHLELLRRGDGGKAFLKIMRGFELTTTKRDRYRAALGSDAYPVQVVWGERDPALRIGTHGEAVRRAAGLNTIIRLPAKHFLQEDQAPAIADRVADLVRGC